MHYINRENMKKNFSRYSCSLGHFHKKKSYKYRLFFGTLLLKKYSHNYKEKKKKKILATIKKFKI